MTADAEPLPPTQDSPPKRFGRPLLVALLVGFALLAVRSASVVEATNETWDADYHVLHGLLDLTNFRHGRPQPFAYNDPPLGGMLVALPVWLTGGTVLGVPQENDPKAYEWPSRPSSLWGQSQSPNTLRHLISLWKCVLLLPGLAAAFLWARRLYGPPAGWLAWALLLFEPTVAAMTPLATLDSIGLSFTLAAAYLIWRYFEAPTWRRMALAAVVTAAALATKHTAVMLPVYAVLTATLAWRARREPAWQPAGRTALAAAMTLVLLWPMTKFDLSAPAEVRSAGNLGLDRGDRPWWEAKLVGKVADWQFARMPAGSYVGSFLEGMSHDAKGHPGYLWGEVRQHGWWYYFPVLATYKVPIGYGVVILLGLLSLLWNKPTLREGPLWVAAACWVALLLKTNIDIGWRHALVPYALVLVAASRCVAVPFARPRLQKAAAALALLAAGASAVGASLWHPNHLAYFNRPIDKAYLAVSDSNVDWGQSARQVGRWLEMRRDALPTPIYYSGFGPAEPVRRYVKGVTILGGRDALPASGTLIVSPVNVAGPYERTDRFAPLRSAEPAARIAETMLVFDLSEVSPAR